MIGNFFTRPAPHEHAEAARRAQAAAELPPDSEELKTLLMRDPAPEVRAAAARRAGDLDLLANAFRGEQDAQVRTAIAATLGERIARGDGPPPGQSPVALDDSIWLEVARHTRDSEQRRLALAAISDQHALVELALSAASADTRVAAAERVDATDALQRLADGARNKDHGVYRIARQRLDAQRTRMEQAAEADVILDALEALAHRPGPILTDVVELNRRWQALDMSQDATRRARCEAARRGVQARLEREQGEARARSRLDASALEWRDALEALAEPDTASLAELRARLDALREEALALEHGAVLAALGEGEQRLAQRERELAALVQTETLVLEAERLAAGTYIDPGDLPKRWEALERSLRTPAFTRRFEAALLAVEHRRRTHTELAQQEAQAVRQQLHAMLHAAEQALSAGQLREARAASDEVKRLRPAAGTLPKPTIQRIGRLTQELAELERWQSFGQQNARVQLCERAEALAQFSGDMRSLAQQVQSLRNEWKALDEQYAGVPKALWERFDRACEKAYAPAARHFAEQAARRKEARRKREEFIAAAADQVQLLLVEPSDWRAIERWLRETEQKWREGELGSIEPRLWKALDARLREALVPLRESLSQAREQAKRGRRALIEEAQALAAKAFERETPSQVKAIQARWQEQAKAMSLAPRDERLLWEEFRAACDAIFKQREEKRSQADTRKQEAHRELDGIVAAVEALAHAADKNDEQIRRELRELQTRWRAQAGGGAGTRGVEARYRHALAAAEALLRSRARSREAAVWDTLAAKEQLCERLDAMAIKGAADAAGEAETARSQWAALPRLAPACEQRMLARRDAALQALEADPAAASAHAKRVGEAAVRRREELMALELLLGLDTPPELQSERLALQVKQLRDRFRNVANASAENPGERLCDWCAEPGVLDARDRARAQRVFAAVARRR